MSDQEPFAFDPEILGQIRRRLAGVDELWRRQEAAGRAVAAPGSLAAADDALPHARFVRIHATEVATASVDHLSAWRLLINAPMVPIMAHLTLLRASLEGAVRCRWLVDPTQDSRTRVARGYAARLDDQIERRKFESSAEGGSRPSQPTTGKTASERVDEVEAARRATLDPSDPTAGIPSVRFTDTTSLMIAAGHERWFRFTSGATHGKEWAYMAADLTPTTGTTPPPGVGHGIITASEPVALALTIVAVRAASSAVADLESYVAAPMPAGRP